jgi:hypothetical protein
MPTQTLKQIEISVSTFGSLQRLAEPLVDTPDTVIARLIACYEKQNMTLVSNANALSRFTRVFDCREAPDLTHTKLLTAKINGKTLEGANWNKLLSYSVIIAANQCRTDDDLRRAIIINFEKGRKEDAGYHFIPGVNLSIQGQSAGDAWKAIWHVVKRFDLSIEVDFIWRDKPEAAFPGEAGHFVWKYECSQKL